MSHKLSKISLAVLSATAMHMTASVQAQEAPAAAKQAVEVIEVTGIRSSLTSALAEKRDSTNLVEVIQAHDIGKLPDQNLAEVLENVTGIQITRTAGVGTGVQIRGTNANRVEINGVSTVGSGGGRNGIDFEDVSAAIISAVEVTKSPEAKTTEGSVGGTINLRTIRPLQLSETLANVRVQGEDSSLSTESLMPRFSGTFGDNWDTDAGRFGFVIAASYTEQEAVSFRPRADRDTIDDNGNLGIQFLLQEQENDDYETVNVATTFEFAPNDNLKFHVDAIINQQEQSRDQYRLQASGVGGLKNFSGPTETETVNFGTLGGNELGTFQAAYKGNLEPNLALDGDDPNLRVSSETGSRITDSEVFVFGGEWQSDNYKVSAELSSSSSDSTKPKFETTTNFINPNTPIGSGNDNAVPFKYDLSGESLSFGINFDSQYAPSVEELLTPSNYVFEKLEQGADTQENSEDGFRVDVEYYVDNSAITSVDFGYRFSASQSTYNRVNDSFSFSQMEDSPNASLFEELLVVGPDNFGDGDGRELFIKDFLLVDPDRSFSDPQGTLDILHAALDAHRVLNPTADGRTRIDSSPDLNAFYDVQEDTHALYAQANFEYENIRGNFGVRYVSTDVDSTGYAPSIGGADRELATTSGSYDFILPRINVVADITDDITFRLGYGSDIRRPDFSQLNTGFNFNDNENTAVALGNPSLSPEEVVSFDLSLEWYFAEASVVSVGYFTKNRTDIFGTKTFGAALHESTTTDSGFARETDPSCPGGGMWNPEVVPNQLGDANTKGLCVDFTQDSNDPVSTMQSGLEFAVQYDLAGFEDDLGWASGFGVIANYTTQDFHGGSVEDCTFSRGAQVLGDICADRGLEDFSENAYNFTLYYDKFGISARMRYTYRDDFISTDFGGGSSTSSTLSFPVVTADRGQLNASVNYDVTDKLNVGFEAVNLTKEGIKQYCVNEDALLCFVGLPDRRITFGASYKF